MILIQKATSMMVKQYHTDSIKLQETERKVILVRTDEMNLILQCSIGHSPVFLPRHLLE